MRGNYLNDVYMEEVLHECAYMWNHWVVRANTPFQPFSDFETARKIWASLMKSFPQMVAAVLMPNHGHFILPKLKEEGRVRYKLGGVIGQVNKSKKIRDYWQVIPPPALIPDQHHLRRQVRYVALNPCRKGLRKDPLEWYWSTYRELFGAAVDCSGRSEALAELLREARRDFLVRFHSYVSGDPSVSIQGTPFPKLLSPQAYSYKSLDEIWGASAAALRVSPLSVKKKGDLRILFIHLAFSHGWRRRTALLAEICGISTRAVRHILRGPVPEGMEAAHLCLSDLRLRLNHPQLLPQSGSKWAIHPQGVTGFLPLRGRLPRRYPNKEFTLISL